MVTSRTVLFVHGAFQGGWVWDKVIPLLPSNYHVLAPTLTGLDRESEERMATTGLHDHIAEICRIIDENNLKDIILVGHSYGGLVISCVAGLRSSKIRQLIYVDALIPGENDSLLKMVGPENAQFFLESAKKGQGWKIDPFPPGAFGLTKEEDIAIANRLHCSQSLQCFTEEVSLPTQDQLASMKISFILCRQSSPLMKELAKKAKDLEWDYYEMEVPHCPMITHSWELASLLQTIFHHQ